MFSEDECMALQDLLELDCMFEADYNGSKIEDEKCKLVRDFLSKVKSRSKTLPKVEFPSNCEWFNTSEAWTSQHMNGRLCLLDFWTYCCINCMHILPDLEALEDAFKENDTVAVIGVHSAKFDNERVGENIKNAIDRYEIKHPVINDSQAALWQSLSISCWPTVLLCDPDGKPIKFFVGEGHREQMIEFVNVALEFYDENLSKVSRITLPKIDINSSVTVSTLRFPGKITVHNEKLYISDSGSHRVLISNMDGKVNTIIGSSIRGHLDGKLNEAKFNCPQGLTVIGNNLFVCDTNNHVIRQINLEEGTVSTIAGNGRQCLNSQMTSGQNALDLALASPWDIIPYEEGLLIAMAGTHQLWKYDLQTKIMSLVAGTGKEENRNNSYPLKASFAQPSGLCYHQKTIFIADSESSSIRQFHSKSGVKNVCGGAKNPVDLFAYGDKDGKGSDAKLQHPLGVTIVPDDKLFVADSYNHKLKLVTELSSKNSNCSTCPVEGLNEPGGLAFDGKDSLLIADTNNHFIKKINIKTFNVDVLNIELPQSSNNDELDLSGEALILKFAKNQPMNIKLKLPAGFVLNTSAPNVWKIQANQNCKGVVDSKLQFEIAGPNDDCFALMIKLYLCLNDTCTVKEKTVIFKADDSQSLNSNYVIDV